MIKLDSREFSRLRASAGPPECPCVPLEARQLTRTMNSRPILDRLDLSISGGEIVALVGTNGVGKTTLLRCLAGRLLPTAGEVLWYGASPRRRPASHRHVGFAAHESFLYLELTARENLLFAGRMCGVARPESRVDKMLTRIDLHTLADQVAARMSRGMRQRLSLARALIHDPPIVILDEPFSGLDVCSRQWLEEWLAELRTQGRAVLFTSHDEEQCSRVADRTLELKECRLSATASLVGERFARSA